MSSEKSYEAEIRQSRLMLVVASMLLVVVPIAGAVVVFDDPFLRLMIILPTVVLALLVAIARRRFPIRRRGLVAVREDWLVLDGQPILDRKNIRGVFPENSSSPAVVIAERGIRSLRATTIQLGSRDDLAALLGNLKWDEANAAQEFALIDAERVVWPAVLATGTVTALLLIAKDTLQLDPRLFTVIWLGSFLAIFLPQLRTQSTRVRDGSDGVFVTMRGKKRFVGYPKIRAVTRGTHHVTIELAPGESIRLSHGKPDALLDAAHKLNPVSLIDALFQRIENARALFASHAEIRSHLLAALKRDGRSLEAWRAAATSLSHEQYRVASTPRDVLENIVQDSAVAPDVRIGAAIALHADAGTRVRVATETSALPELGAAIDAALDGDDPALEKAIATLKLTS